LSDFQKCHPIFKSARGKTQLIRSKTQKTPWNVLTTDFIQKMKSANSNNHKIPKQEIHTTTTKILLKYSKGSNKGGELSFVK